MKKFKLITMLLMLTAIQALAMPVDELRARSIAMSYLTNMSGNVLQSINATGNNGMQLLHVEMGSSNSGQPVFYIYNTSTSFLVVAGDDRAVEILMIGDRPLADINNLPPAMQDMLDQYEEEIDFLHDHPDLVVDNSIMINALPQDITVGPLLNATWDQKEPYWDQCRFDYDGTLYQCLTGCPATSSAMVLHYWKYPNTQVDAIDSYVSALNLSSSLSNKQYTYPELPATTFDWENMKDNYDSYTDVEGNAVATLMRYVGQAVEMIYGTMNAGGSGIYSNHSQKLVDMFVRFGYDPSTCRVVKQENFSAFIWKQLIQNEMIAGRPVVYMGKSVNGLAHAFNVDGYDSSNEKFHVNFGWSGEGNSWCSMNSFSYSNYNFNKNQQAIIGIQPPEDPELTPTVTVNPTTLSFDGCAIGESYTKTLTVTGTNLKNNVVITSNSEFFTVAPAVLTAAQAQDGASVTVTYNPIELGSTSASLTISCDGAEPQTVSLRGESSLISTSVDSINFGSVEVGYPVKKYFNVTGNNLNNDISLRIETRSVNYYKVSPETITPEQADNGVNVTVTYSPGSWWWTDANLILSSPEIEEITIPITADPYYPESFSKNQTISLEAYVGQHVYNTGAVRFADAEIPDPIIPPVVVSEFDRQGVSFNIPAGYEGMENYSVSLTGDPDFTVRIVKASALANICTVRISYNPSSVGTHQARLTLHCSKAGVPYFDLNLNGTASLLKVDPVLNSVQEQDMTDTSFKAIWSSGCYEEGIRDFTIECAPQGTEFDPQDPEYRFIEGLLPNDCHYTGWYHHSIDGLNKKYSYTISDLNPDLTYCYRVKTNFIDFTESQWSNVETVTLMPEAEFLAGDLDQNGAIGINDVTSLIDIVLERTELPNSADVNRDGVVNISDVTDLIDLLISGNAK